MNILNSIAADMHLEALLAITNAEDGAWNDDGLTKLMVRHNGSYSRTLVVKTLSQTVVFDAVKKTGGWALVNVEAAYDIRQSWGILQSIQEWNRVLRRIQILNMLPETGGRLWEDPSTSYRNDEFREPVEKRRRIW